MYGVEFLCLIVLRFDGHPGHLVSGAIAMQDLIWIGVSVGFVALGMLYVALAGKA